MKSIIRYGFLVFAFFLSIEGAFKLKYSHDKDFYPSNLETPSEKYRAMWDDVSIKANTKSEDKPRLFLIGDSFLDAEDYGGKESYIPYFTQLTLKNDWELYNLSLAGTSINDHKMVMDQIEGQSNNVYIFSIKIHDILKLTEVIGVNPVSSSMPLSNSFQSEVITLLSKSDLVYLLKDILHHFFMRWNHTPAPHTHLYKTLVHPSSDKLENLSTFLCDLNNKSGTLIVLVNYPYNFKYDVNELNSFKLYRHLSSISCSDLVILQSPLIINEKESVDWRNVHPNSISMKKVFNFIQQEIEKNQ